MKVANYIITRLENEGIRHAFCFVGGGSIFLTDALSGSQIKPIFLLHEQSCAVAADAYAQTTGHLGLVIVTTGPGVLNAMTGVAAAYIDSTPLIVLSGQVNVNQMKKYTGLRQRGIQEVDTLSLVAPITKSVMLCDIATLIPNQLEESISNATTGRKGPAWLDIPLDMQQKDIVI